MPEEQSMVITQAHYRTEYASTHQETHLKAKQCIQGSVWHLH